MAIERINIRRYRIGDEAELASVFNRTVRELAPSKYAPAQVEAWLANAPDSAAIRERISQRESFVAEVHGVIVGWAELTESGHFDVLYVAPEWTGKGVADELYSEVVGRARQLGLTRLHTEASYFAESFLNRNGWTLDERETIIRSGIKIVRAKMSILLSS